MRSEPSTLATPIQGIIVRRVEAVRATTIDVPRGGAPLPRQRERSRRGVPPVEAAQTYAQSECAQSDSARLHPISVMRVGVHQSELNRVAVLRLPLRPTSTPVEGIMSETSNETPVLDLLARMTADSIDAAHLDVETLMLVRIAALVAIGAPPVSYAMNLQVAGEIALDPEKLRGVFMAVAPIVGTARVAAATGNIAKALEVEL